MKILFSNLKQHGISMTYTGRNEGGKTAYLLKELDFLVSYFSLPVSVSSSISGVIIRKHTEDTEIKMINCYMKIKEYLSHRTAGTHHFFPYTFGERSQTPINSSTVKVVTHNFSVSEFRTLDSLKW